MDPFKSIIKGRLEFGNQKSYDMMLAHFQKRLETYYKNDMLLKDPIYFNAEKLFIDVPRSTHTSSEKTWKNTASLLRELKSYAVAGELSISVSDPNNQPIFCETIIPQGDKVATTEYLKGVVLIEKGSFDAAIECLNKAIDKYDDYYQAYEKRALAHFRAGRIEDALVDYAKSLALFPNSEALLGQAEVKASFGDHVGALLDYQKSVDAAAPFEPVFWKCRRMKGEYHAQRNELDKAIFELKLVTKRPFAETDPNYPFRKQAWQLYSEVLLKAGKKVESAAALQAALAIVDTNFSGNLLDSNGGTQEKTVRGAVAAA